MRTDIGASFSAGTGSAPRLVFLGQNCEFTRLPLEAVLKAGWPVGALIIPSLTSAGPLVARRPAPDLPLYPDDAVRLAQAAGVPVYAVRALRSPAALDLLAALRPEILCAACFPRRLPAEWLAAPARGALNVHPSLLPTYRGPEPLFWQFRNGETTTGVTVHWMDAEFDTGPIAAQAAVRFPDGISAAEAEALTARAGAALLLEALAAPTPARPQPPAGASYFPRPAAADYVVPASWPARRAFNFLRGADRWGPLEVAGPAGRWRVTAALAYADAPTGEAPAGALWLPFSPGVVLARAVAA